MTYSPQTYHLDNGAEYTRKDIADKRIAELEHEIKLIKSVDCGAAILNRMSMDNEKAYKAESKGKSVRIKMLERQNADLQKNNTDLVNERRELKKELAVLMGQSNENTNILPNAADYEAGE